LTAWRTSGALLLGVCVAGCAVIDAPADMRVDDRSAQRQLLVMLRTAPPHFRPGAGYAGSYDPGAGHDPQRRLAEALAEQYQLAVINDWPMPAIGVDCFVMQVPGSASIERLVDQLSLDPRVESAQSMYLFHVLAGARP
jgi:hypothetical protein